MKIALTINKTYVYEPMEAPPEDKELLARLLASGQIAPLGRGGYGQRAVRECPEGKTVDGRDAQLITEVRPDFFDQLGEDKNNNFKRAALLGLHFQAKVLPWNAPADAIIAVSVEGDEALETALAGFFGVKE